MGFPTEMQTDQMVQEAALAVLRQAARTQLKDILTAIDSNFNSPLRMYASNPSDAVLNMGAQEIQQADGTGKSVPPTSSTIPTVVASTINFQTGGTTGATFINLTFPTTTIGQFRRLGLTLLASGQINAIWSAAAASLGALANPGTVFVPSGIPLGWLDLEATGATAFKTAGSATNIIENSVGGVSRIHVFGSGGSGSGSGNANSFLTSLLERLNDSFFNRLAYNIFTLDGDTKTDPASTAVYDIANGEYDFTGAQVLKSLALFTPGFLANDQDMKQVELIEDWSSFAGTPTREVSVDGGLNYNTVTMTQIDVTNRYRGIASIAEPVTTAQLYTFDVANADSTEPFNATDRKSHAVQLATIASGVKRKVTKVTVYLNKVGSPAGYVTARIVKDSSGQPGTGSTDTVAISAPQNIASLSAGNNTVVFNFTAILPAGTYWLVLDTETGYANSFVSTTTELRWRTDASSPSYALGYSKFDGSAWTAIATEKPTFLIEGITYSLIVRITSSATSAILGYGLLFENQTINSPFQMPENYEEQFSGDIDKQSFTATFLPDPKTMIAVDTTPNSDFAGRAFMYPYFSLDGHNVVFPSGTFFEPGVTKRVKFFNIGSGFDNSDVNRALMAANHLGSSDASVDQSVAGRGVVLRRPDGTLRELRINNLDGIDILSYP